MTTGFILILLLTMACCLMGIAILMMHSLVEDLKKENKRLQQQK